MWKLYNAAKNQLTTLKGQQVALGRSENNDVMISGPGISRQHAQLQLTGNGWLLQDRGSSNGTFVNGQRVDSRLLMDGDRIGLGQQCTLILQHKNESHQQNSGNHQQSIHEHDSDSTQSIIKAIGIALAVLMIGSAIYKVLNVHNKVSHINNITSTLQQPQPSSPAKPKTAPPIEIYKLVGSWESISFYGVAGMTAKTFRMELDINKDMKAYIKAIQFRSGSDRVDKTTGYIENNNLIMDGKRAELTLSGSHLELFAPDQSLTVTFQKISI